jgi:hypothetical protein
MKTPLDIDRAGVWLFWLAFAFLVTGTLFAIVTCVLVAAVMFLRWTVAKEGRTEETPPESLPDWVGR